MAVATQRPFLLALGLSFLLLSGCKAFSSNAGSKYSSATFKDGKTEASWIQTLETMFMDHRIKGAAAAISAALLLGSMGQLPAFADFEDTDKGPVLAGRCRQETNGASGVTTISCRRYGTDRDGRLLGCLPNENCLSTSAVKNPSKYAAPWTYYTQTASGDSAWKALVELAETDSLNLGLKVVEKDPSRYYLHLTAPAKVPPGSTDDLEFLLRPADKIVLYRSATRDTVLVYPFQQPLSDQESNLKRIEQIRSELGWGPYDQDAY